MRFNPETFNYCLQHTTIENKLLCTTEECAELAQCCTKWLRGRKQDKDHLIEEMSDVIVNIYLLMSELDIDSYDIHKIAEEKLARFVQRLEAGEKP